MQVVVAENCVFCEGVRRAVDTAFSLPPENMYVLGELIHNPDVVKKLTERGVKTVSSAEEVPSGSTLLIRSHGVGRELYDACERRGVHVVDCTCGFVRRTQNIVRRAGEEGKTVAIAGDPDHPEVRGLVGWCAGEKFVFSSKDDDFSVLRGKNVVLVAQTTFSEQRFSEIAENLKKVSPKTVEIFGTICYTTVCRQQEAAKIAAECDAVLVIGGAESSNTSRLYEIASAHCGKVIRLTSADDFEYETVKFCKRVGIIAGASTPDWQTREVLFKMEENKAEVQETTPVVEEVAEETVAETAAPVEEPAAEVATEAVTAEEAKEPAAEAEQKAEEPAAQPEEKPAPVKNEFEQAVDAFEKNERYKKGQLVTAHIVSATDEGIYVSASGKLEIFIEKADLDCEEYSREAYASRVGEEIRLMVVEVVPKAKLSEKAVRKILEEEALLKDIEDGKEFSVVCTGTNKGGLTAELGTYPVFVPAREIRSGYVKELDKYVGKTLRLKLIEIRKERRKEIIASQRVILEAERAEREAARAEREAAFFESIAVGDVVEGKVERVTNFGAFVSVNGFDCLAHISDLSWTGVKNVTDVLEIGKRYEFKVLKVDRDNKKVSIGYKQLQQQPWDLAAEKYAEGEIVHGKVVRIVPFGAFVELEKGIDGLVHVSQISHEWLENPTSVLTIGQEVDAKITAFNPAERKINLSIKALEPRPEFEHTEREPRRDRDENRRPRKNNRRGGNTDGEDEEEYREWKEGGAFGASIADLIGKDDEEK